MKQPVVDLSTSTPSDVESEGEADAISERADVALGGVYLDERPHAEPCHFVAP